MIFNRRYFLLVNNPKINLYSKKINFSLCVSLVSIGIFTAHLAKADPNTDAQTAADKIERLSWVHGPATVRLYGGAEFDVPTGYKALSSPDANDFIALEGNPRPTIQEYIITPDINQDTWFAVVEYNNAGHVDDSGQINADALLNSQQISNENDLKERASQGLPPLRLIGWQLQPDYDPLSHRLEWSFRYQANNGLVVNLNTRILTRLGFYRALLVTMPETFSHDTAEFNSVLNSLKVDTSNQYSDYRSGDKLAEYGLAGLIGGGAVAVAAKTGILAAVFAGVAKIFGALGLKTIGVAIFGAIIAVFAAIKNLFKRIFSMGNKNSDDKP